MSQIESVPALPTAGEIAQNPIDAYNDTLSTLWQLPEQDTAALTVTERAHERNGSTSRVVQARTIEMDNRSYTATIRPAAFNTETGAVMVPGIGVGLYRNDEQGGAYVCDVNYAPNPDGTITAKVDTSTNDPLTREDKEFASSIGMGTAVAVAEASRAADAASGEHQAAYVASAEEVASLGSLHERVMHYAGAVATA